MSKRIFVLLLFVMSGVYFFAFFHRIAIPGTVFNQMQIELNASASAIAGLGAAFLYPYAMMQLGTGALADRFGGYFLVVVGAAVITLVAVLMSLVNHIVVLYICRIVLGFGAAMVYIAIVKEIDLNLPKRDFPFMIGVLTVIGSLGALFATLPFAAIAGAYGWRFSLRLTAIGSGLLMIILLMFYRHYQFKPEQRNHSLFKSFGSIISNRRNIPICLYATLNFAIYFTTQTLLGKKFIEDFVGLSSEKAAVYPFLMIIPSMFCPLIYGWANRKKPHWLKHCLCGSSILMLLAVSTIMAGILFKAPGIVFLPAFCSLSVSAAMLPLSLVYVREINRSDAFALSLGLLNGLEYVAASCTICMVGFLLDAFREQAVVTATAVIYPASAYLAVTAVLLILALISLVASLCLSQSNRTASQI